MRIRGAQGILGRAAIHGAVELGRHPLQNQLLPLPLGAAVQKAAPHPRPGEEGLGEHLVLRTQVGWRKRNEGAGAGTDERTGRTGERVCESQPRD